MALQSPGQAVLVKQNLPAAPHCLSAERAAAGRGVPKPASNHWVPGQPLGSVLSSLWPLISWAWAGSRQEDASQIHL